MEGHINTHSSFLFKPPSSVSKFILEKTVLALTYDRQIERFELGDIYWKLAKCHTILNKLIGIQFWHFLHLT